MRTVRFLLALIMAATLSGRGQIQAGEAAEKLRKSKRDFALADADLNKTFQKLRKNLPEDDFKELRDNQRKWIEYRDYMSADQPRQNGFRGEDPKQSADYWESMASLTKSRIEFLEAAFDEGLPKGISGSYEDSFGGSLNLEERADGVVFQIEVVRGPTSHTGGLAGLASLKGDAAYYKEKVEAGDDREPCELSFSFSKGHIVRIDGKNTDYYHGARAYFVGIYYKVGKLEESIDLNATPDK